MRKLTEDWERIGDLLYKILNIWAVLTIVFVPLGVWKLIDLIIVLIKKLK